MGSLSALAASSDLSALLPHIEQFEREEVSRQLSLLRCAPQPSSTLPRVVQRVIQEHVAETIPSVHQPPVAPALILSRVAAPVAPPVVSPIEAYLEAPLTYASVVTRQPLAPFPSFVCPAEKPAAPYPRMATRTPNPWRTPDNRPIGFAFRLPGHVARLCHRRPQPPVDAYQFPAYGFPPLFAPATSSATPTSYSADQSTSTPSSHRSFSPRHRSFPRCAHVPTLQLRETSGRSSGGNICAHVELLKSSVFA